MTRLNEQVGFLVIDARALGPGAGLASVRVDEILVDDRCATADNGRFSRLVVRWDTPKTARIFGFLKGYFDVVLSWGSVLCQWRRHVELFSKTLRKNLRVTTCLRTSANPLESQILTAPISMLPAVLLHLRSRLGSSRSWLVLPLWQQLIDWRDVLRWIDHRFEGPPQRVAGGIEKLAVSWWQARPREINLSRGIRPKWATSRLFSLESGGGSAAIMESSHGSN